MMKLARMGAGYTQLSLANEIGVKERLITLIETGRTQSSPAVAKRISEVLKTRKDKLFPDLFLKEAEEAKK
jgi:DNA-binding XRE family transcriptional regulator